MIHPVTIKDAQGNTMRIISSDSLEQRSTAICQAGDGHFASHKMRELVCEKPKCGKTFFTKQRGKKYCSKDCTVDVGRATALETKKKRKQKMISEKSVDTEPT